MTPQEWAVVYTLLEKASRAFYAQGKKDAGLGKSLENKDFILSPANKLSLHTYMERSTKNR